MFKQGVGSFKYYVGISSLDQIATRDDRVCVLNILGGESSDVTPVGHEYSGGNVVFGTSPGRSGQVLETPVGNVPVYSNVREGLEAGHRFNCGVIYLPPSGARDGVAELIRVNPELKKIFIVTEKLSVHDSREIRTMGQQNGIDIFGGNPPYEKMKEVARICFKHWLKQSNVLFIIGGKSNNTDIFETFRAVADALREHFGKHGPSPLYVVAGRGGPNLVRGMGALRDTLEALGLPYRLFGFDSDMSEVINHARAADAWMKAGGRDEIAAKLRIPVAAAA